MLFPLFCRATVWVAQLFVELKLKITQIKNKPHRFSGLIPHATQKTVIFRIAGVAWHLAEAAETGTV